MPKLPDICAYCGFSPSNKRDLTSDHIPPKKLFPKPRPFGIITVPACRSCHANTSKDDEYFCLKISMRNNVQNNPAASTIAHDLISSLGRVQSVDFRRQILSDMRYIDLKTSGLYTGLRLFAYDVDMVRIFRVVERVVRGLYFVKTGKPLGLENEVRSTTIDDMQRQPKSLEQLKQTILPFMTPPEKIGNDVFLYRYAIAPDKPAYSAWIISLYGNVVFFSMTGLQSDRPREPY